MFSIFSRIEKKKISTIISLGLLVALFVGVRFYWSMQKEEYNLDEIYSYQFIGGGEMVMPHRDDALLNVWHDDEFFTDYITIDEDEMYNFSRVSNKTAQDVHPPLYYWLLHISTILIDGGSMGLWGGITVNLIAVSFSTILLYFLSIFIFQKRYLAIITCVIWGLSIAAVSDAVFLRMYSVLTTFVIGFTFAAFHSYRADKLTWKNYSAILLTSICGLLTHYFFIFLFIPLSLYILVRTFFMKRYRKALSYLVIFFFSILIFYFIFPTAKQHLFSSYRSREILDKIAFSISEKVTIFLERVDAFNEVFNDQVFFGILVITVVLLFAAVIKWLIIKNSSDEFPESVFLTVFLALFWIVVAAYSAPYAYMRYLVPILPLLILSIVGLTNFLFESKKIKYILLIVLIGATIFTFFRGSVNYLYIGSEEKWNSFIADHQLSVLIISQQQRVFTVNTVIPYLINKHVYVTTVDDLSHMKNKIALNESNNNEIYIFVEKRSLDEIDLSEYGSMKLLFSHVYHNIYKLTINKSSEYIKL